MLYEYLRQPYEIQVAECLKTCKLSRFIEGSCPLNNNNDLSYFNWLICSLSKLLLLMKDLYIAKNELVFTRIKVKAKTYKDKS